MNNTCPPRFTAAAGTKFAGTSYLRYCHYHLLRKNFTIFTFFVHTILLDQAMLIVQNSSLQPITVRAVFIPIVADHPPRPTKNQRLGKLLTLPTT